MQKTLKSHGTWIGKWTFVLAATGSAVGLGNIWGFPYKAGTEGGGAFVLLYLLCILLICTVFLTIVSCASLSPYKVPVLQGNLFEEEDVEKLSEGL